MLDENIREWRFGMEGSMLAGANDAPALAPFTA